MMAWVLSRDRGWRLERVLIGRHPLRGDDGCGAAGDTGNVRKQAAAVLQLDRSQPDSPPCNVLLVHDR